MTTANVDRSTELGALEQEEPPGEASLGSDSEQPPSKTEEGYRRRFFEHVADREWNDWRWQMRNRVSTVEGLSDFLSLSNREMAQLRLVTRKYPMSVTPYYLSLIDPRDPKDPIRKQATPSFLESVHGSIGQGDPLGEEKDSVMQGLVHRYPDRVLMVLTNVCPVLCRHCTRKREWQHGGWVRVPSDIERMFDYIRSNEGIRDVIISGGDCLTLSTRRLEEVIVGLRRIPHVEIIRIGSRYPVVLPQRIDDDLCGMLSKHGPIWLNTHFNHPNEVTPEAAQACDKLLRAGVPVNNQSVLLRGINDTVETQKKLCQELMKIKVRPYYLFQCDEVQGTEHLRTPIEAGIRIIEGMRGHTSGLAVPTFVVDLPQGGGKISLQPDYVLSQTQNEWILRNYEGNVFTYRNPRPNCNGKTRHSKGKTQRGNGSRPCDEYQFTGSR